MLSSLDDVWQQRKVIYKVRTPPDPGLIAVTIAATFAAFFTNSLTEFYDRTLNGIDAFICELKDKSLMHDPYKQSFG